MSPADDITPDDVVAYVDGELDAAASARIAAAAEADPALAAQIDDHRRLRARLAIAFAPIAEEPVPQALLDTVAAPSSATVIPFAARLKVQLWALPAVAQVAGMAACLVAGIALTLVATRGPTGDVTTKAGVLMAQGELARALSTQMAADTARPVRVNLTFRDKAGSVCRTFATRALDGLACRDGAQWRIDMTTQAVAQQAYRQAASLTIMQAVSDRIDGDTFDAATERKARDSQWAGGKE